MMVRGVRGATSVTSDTPAEILQETKQLLIEMVARNNIELTDIASVFFTTSPGVVSEFPAKAARQLGWSDIPLLCGHEMAVENGLDRCIRVMIHWNTDKTQSEIQHVYLNEAVKLRPDLVGQ